LDATLSAKRLFVHRNTFLYRLNRFIELTNLDIRDYHNALFLELYFQLSAGRGLA
jgi:DNA-binding PucR family transcriptional regulator